MALVPAGVSGCGELVPIEAGLVTRLCEPGIAFPAPLSRRSSGRLSTWTMNRQELVVAALAAADRSLKSRGYIALDEVFRDMGKLDAADWEGWRRGRVPYLERVIRLNLSQISAVCRAVHASAKKGNLKPSWTAYRAWGKGARTTLRFTKSGEPYLERVWATRYVWNRGQSGKDGGPAAPGGDAGDGGQPGCGTDPGDPSRESKDGVGPA